MTQLPFLLTFGGHPMLGLLLAELVVWYLWRTKQLSLLGTSVMFFVLSSVLFSWVPDLDVIPHKLFALMEDHPLAHRMAMHSYIFSIIPAVLMARVFAREFRSRRFVCYLFWFYFLLFAHITSDMLNDTYCKVACAWPFTEERFLLPPQMRIIPDAEIHISSMYWGGDFWTAFAVELSWLFVLGLFTFPMVEYAARLSGKTEVKPQLPLQRRRKIRKVWPTRRPVAVPA